MEWFIGGFCVFCIFLYLTTPWIRNYPTNKGLDVVFKKCLDSGTKSISSDQYYTEVGFNNGYTIKFWNTNPMYAYASRGLVTTPEGKKTYWDATMPSRRMNKRIVKEIQPKTFL